MPPCGTGSAGRSRGTLSQGRFRLPPTGRREAHPAARPPALRSAQRGPAPRSPLGDAAAGRAGGGAGPGAGAGGGGARPWPTWRRSTSGWRAPLPSPRPAAAISLCTSRRALSVSPGPGQRRAGRGRQAGVRPAGSGRAGWGLRAEWSREGPGLGLCLVLTLPLLPAAPWHHIENLDLFFSRISFHSLCGGRGGAV